MIGITSTTAETPRAHITNMAAAGSYPEPQHWSEQNITLTLVSECLRDIDLEDDCRKVASPSSTMMHTRWSYSMAGEEYGRIYSWGNGPDPESKYKDASPCAPMDLPQTLLEPILVRKATMNGFICRFNTEFLSFKENSENATVDVRVKDLIFQHVYTIRCKYLFGADGARSRIIDQLGLPLIKRPGGGLAWNVLVRADLSHLMPNRMGNLHWIYQHDIDHPEFAWIGFPRMVKSWFEWVFIILPVPGYKADFPPTQEQWMKRVKQMIGDDSVDVEILNISKWQINDVVAEQYSEGRVFCLGDAVHRHPPANGLGSNTSVQDAFNLAWKVAYVLQGAFQQLLTS
jgi:2-polyprenyl-6-methoxyphenol hydroxylase-like FAD-dependent oxidoreductase